MWLTLLWQNKGMVIAAACLVIFVGLGTVLKIQSSRLNSALLKIGEVEDQRDTAIQAHDQLVKDWERQKAILSEREALRKQQEEQNAKLRQTIKEALQSSRAWADASIPSRVLETLSTLPENRLTPQSDKPNSSPALRGEN